MTDAEKRCFLELKRAFIKARLVLDVNPHTGEIELRAGGGGADNAIISVLWRWSSMDAAVAGEVPPQLSGIATPVSVFNYTHLIPDSEAARWLKIVGSRRFGSCEELLLLLTVEGEG